MFVTIKKIDLSVASLNVVVEVDPQMFEVANLEERDDVSEDAQAAVCDVLDHNDVETTESVVIDSIVASSHLTESVACEVPPTFADQEALGEANHSDISPRGGRPVSSNQTQSLDGINSPFQRKDSTVSATIARLNFRALLDTSAAVTTVSARVWQKRVSDISLNLGPPNHCSITTVDGYSLKV